MSTIACNSLHVPSPTTPSCRPDKRPAAAHPDALPDPVAAAKSKYVQTIYLTFGLNASIWDTKHNDKIETKRPMPMWRCKNAKMLLRRQGKLAAGRAHAAATTAVRHGFACLARVPQNAPSPLAPNEVRPSTIHVRHVTAVEDIPIFTPVAIYPIDYCCFRTKGEEIRLQTRNDVPPYNDNAKVLDQYG